MIDREPNTKKFIGNLDQVYLMYKEAFAGFPWYENLLYEEIQKRVTVDLSKEGFDSFIAENPNDGNIIGGLWFYSITVSSLESERGKELANFGRFICESNGITNIIWERELMVKPDFQNARIGTRLRTNFVFYLADRYPQGTVILTRLRDDNIGTIKIAERLGYLRSNVRIPSSKNQSLFHEYWYKLVNPPIRRKETL